MLPYGRHCIEQDDIESVIEVLKSDWLTTGPAVPALEQAFAAEVHAGHAVAVSSGTAALHASMFALGIGPGDEVIVPPMTFAATANCVVYQGGTPVFVDVDPESLLMDPAKVEASITSRTKAIIAVDYAGQPCDYDRLRELARRHHVALVADGCHALGARYRDRPVGSLADLTVFSLHPVKHVTAGEGGVITTDDCLLAERLRRFRNHGITADFRARADRATWFYEIEELGYNYRLTDIQCALAKSQLKKLAQWVGRRREIAEQYDETCKGVHTLKPLVVHRDAFHSYHLYVVQLQDCAGVGRPEAFEYFRDRGIGVNVHYIPVHLHPFYRIHFGTGPGLCPTAEHAYERILSLPIFPAMTDDEVDMVIKAIKELSR